MSAALASNRKAATPMRALAGAVGWICLLALPFAVSACRRAASPAAEREERELRRLYGKDARLILKAPPCSATVTVPTTGWKPATVNERPLGFTLPQAFRPDTAPRFMHGGYRWSDGDREFDIVRGDWRPRSFIQEASDGCRTVVAGQPVLVVRSLDSAERLTLAVWPYASPPRGGFGVLVEAVSPNVQDDPLLWTMASAALPAALADTAASKPGSATPAR